MSNEAYKVPLTNSQIRKWSSKKIARKQAEVWRINCFGNHATFVGGKKVITQKATREFEAPQGLFLIVSYWVRFDVLTFQHSLKWKDALNWFGICKGYLMPKKDQKSSTHFPTSTLLKFKMGFQEFTFAENTSLNIKGSNQFCDFRFNWFLVHAVYSPWGLCQPDFVAFSYILTLFRLAEVTVMSVY